MDNLGNEATKEQQPKKKSILSKLRENADDTDEQLVILSAFVRVGILIWSGAVLSLTYIELPSGLWRPSKTIDETFLASVFTGVLATFGVQTSGKKGCTKAEVEELMDRYESRKNNKQPGP